MSEAPHLTEADVARLRAHEMLAGHRAMKAMHMSDVFLDGIKYGRLRAENAIRSGKADQVVLGTHWLSIYDIFDAEVK